MCVAVSEVLRSRSEVFQPHEDPPYLKCDVFAGLQWEIALVHLGHVVSDVLLKLLAGMRTFLNEHLPMPGTQGSQVLWLSADTCVWCCDSNVVLRSVVLGSKAKLYVCQLFAVPV